MTVVFQLAKFYMTYYRHKEQFYGNNDPGQYISGLNIIIIIHSLKV